MFARLSGIEQLHSHWGVSKCYISSNKIPSPIAFFALSLFSTLQLTIRVEMGRWGILRVPSPKVGNIMGALSSGTKKGFLPGGPLPVDHHTCGDKIGPTLTLFCEALKTWFGQWAWEPKSEMETIKWWFDCCHQRVGTYCFSTFLY